jgi:hypothetical protein
MILCSKIAVPYRKQHRNAHAILLFLVIATISVVFCRDLGYLWIFNVSRKEFSYPLPVTEVKEITRLSGYYAEHTTIEHNKFTLDNKLHWRHNLSITRRKTLHTDSKI